MLKKMKLAPKLAIVLGSVLIVIFTALIVTNSRMTKAAITDTVEAELRERSKLNGKIIQEIFNVASGSALDMQQYMENMKEFARQYPELSVHPETPEGKELCHSMLYDRALTPINYDIETFLREYSRNLAMNNDNIAGMGVMFEPYAFQSDFKDYAFYVNGTDAPGTVELWNSYEEYAQEGYYRQAIEKKSPTLTEPYEDYGIQMVTFSAPILDGGKAIGVVIVDIALQNFSRVETSPERYPTMYATIYNENALIIYDTEDAADIGHNISEFTPKQEELAKIRDHMSGDVPFQIETTRESGKKVTRFMTPIDTGAERWWSQTALMTEDMRKDVVRSARWLVFLSIGAQIALLSLTLIVLSRMLRPLGAVARAAKSISRGDLEVHVTVNSWDEIGIMSHTFGKMAGNMRLIINDIGYLLGQMAEGNFQLKTQAEDSYVGDYEEILLSMRRLNRTLSQTLKQIALSSEQVEVGSNHVASSAQALSQGATEQASAVEELAATINEISRRVLETSDNADKASDRANAIGEAANESSEKMADMLSAMEEISQQSGEIGKIIKTIEDIAFQTNILALNAAVEAARAGVSGKGFAVVADEVRNLAAKSAEASKNTASLIEHSLMAVEKGTKIADETAQALETAVSRVQETIGLIDLISDATKEQAAEISQVIEGIDQISSVVQTNAATAEESAAASEELSGQAQLLRGLVGEFQLRED